MSLQRTGPRKGSFSFALSDPPRRGPKPQNRREPSRRVSPRAANCYHSPPSATYPSGKGELCKSFIQRFESACRLQTERESRKRLPFFYGFRFFVFGGG